MSESTVERLLSILATDLSLEKFTDDVLAHPEWMPGRAPLPAASPLPDGAFERLLRVAGLPEGEQERMRRESESAALGARIALHDLTVSRRLLESALTTKQAAQLLERDTSNITRGIKQHRYYAVRVAGALRLPEWQFYERTTYEDYVPGEPFAPDEVYEPLPHLADVVPAIPADLHPLSIEGFMRSAHPDLSSEAVWGEIGGPSVDVVGGESTIGSHTLSPRDWLISGGEPQAVVALLEGMSRR